MQEIRAQAASYSLYSNVSVESILKQWRWTQHSTFTRFYLREVVGQQGELVVLPPVMSAGTVSNDQKRKKEKKRRGTEDRPKRIFPPGGTKRGENFILFHRGHHWLRCKVLEVH